MWEKPTRNSIFSAIYQLLFWHEQNQEQKEVDWVFIFDNLKFDNPPDLQYLQQMINIFQKNEINYSTQIQKYLTEWNKTFLIVKACLYTFILEYESTNLEKTNELNTSIITKYIRLCEDLVGGQNVALVHAVISKILSDDHS